MAKPLTEGDVREFVKVATGTISSHGPRRVVLVPERVIGVREDAFGVISAKDLRTVGRVMDKMVSDGAAEVAEHGNYWLTDKSAGWTRK
jgi:hypothetical protein